LVEAQPNDIAKEAIEDYIMSVWNKIKEPFKILHRYFYLIVSISTITLIFIVLVILQWKLQCCNKRTYRRILTSKYARLYNKEFEPLVKEVNDIKAFAYLMRSLTVQSYFVSL
jgi:hypothetical protein